MIKVPAIKVTKVIGFTDEQIEELKLAAKKEISFTVSFRKRKQKYAAGTFDIRPYRTDKWTEEQFAEIERFMVNHKLTTVGGLSIYDEKTISNYKLYNLSVNTVYSILEYEELEQPITEETIEEVEENKDRKLMLKDVVSQKEINIDVDVMIKGKLSDRETKENIRTLKNVYIKKDKKGNEWLYVEWHPNGRITLNDDNTCNDCGYSGVMLGESHPLEYLYLNVL